MAKVSLIVEKMSEEPSQVKKGVSIPSDAAAARHAKALKAVQLASDLDLVTTNTSDRNWKGIIIAVIVITSVLALIVTSVVLLTPPDEGPRVKGRRFELEDIFSPEFVPRRTNGTWISDDEWLFKDTSGGISVLSASNGTVRSLISTHTFRRFDAKLSAISPDLQYALLVHDVRPIHRYSNTAKYTIYHIETGDFRALSILNNVSEGVETPHSPLQLVKWSPVDSSLIMVHEGDIYFKPHPRNRTTYRLTSTAEPGVIYNGVPDWLYEEEILGSNSALWFSGDGQSLLYLSFNDSLVGKHTMLQYGATEDPYVYPQVKYLRYPKPGTNNPIVIPRVIELKQSRSANYRVPEREMRPPEGISSMDYYVTSAGWVKSNEVAITWTSRSYNLSIISICSAKNGSCEEMYRISTEKRGWVDTIPFPFFTTKPGSSNFITIAPIRDGENGFFDHLVLVDTAHKRSHPLTHGSMDIIKINAWDEDRKLIYFLAIPAKTPKERRLYRLRVEQPYTDHSPECLSCDKIEAMVPATMPSENKTALAIPKVKKKPGKEINTANTGKNPEGLGPTIGSNVEGQGSYYLDTAPGSEQHQQQQLKKGKAAGGGKGQENSLLGNNRLCSFVVSVRFSSAKSHFTLECGGPNVPYVALCSASPSNLRLIQILQNNDALRNLSNAMAFPQTRIFDVQLNAGYTVQVRLLLPPGLREDEITKYPLVLNVYGGPGTQLALDRWGVDFPSYLASKKDYIVAQVDSRGSGGRGWDFQHKVYYKLGLLEAEDQIEVVRNLRDSLHFVEPKKVGVWGWSFGGYLTAMIMANKDSTDLFQCGASVAPVTSWKLYDSAYTERYMGKPNITENYKGYAESDVTQNVEHFASKMFYLLHGTADDNVHIQHSMLLAKALVNKKILFRQQIYPDEPHSLKGVQLHVHKSLEVFFEDCFRKQADPELGTGLYKGGKFEDFDKK